MFDTVKPPFVCPNCRESTEFGLTPRGELQCLRCKMIFPIKKEKEPLFDPITMRAVAYFFTSKKKKPILELDVADLSMEDEEDE